jgi:hypothetical protein
MLWGAVIDEAMNDARALLRHTLATVAYRGRKAVSGAPPGFADVRISETSRTPVEILAHIGDLFDWAFSLVHGQHVWHDSTPLPWDQEVARFFEAMEKLDEALAGDAPLGCPEQRIFQGPIADALTHIGQIAMIRRAAGGPVRGENYYAADIASGRVGFLQSPPKVEFD